MSKLIRSIRDCEPSKAATYFFTVALLLTVGIAMALVRDRNIAGGTGVSEAVPAFAWKTVYLPVEPSGYTEALADVVRFVPNETIWVDSFKCDYRAKEGTVTACGVMLEKNSTNMGTGVIDLSGVNASAYSAITLSPSPFSVTTSDNLTVDVDTFTGGGTMWAIGCQLHYRTLVGSEAIP